MIPLIKLREDLKFTRELQEMFEVLKGATSSQFRSLQQKRKGSEEFKIRLESFFSTLEVRLTAHPFLRENPDLPKAVVMITSDEGFAGGLNSSIVGAGLEQTSSQDELIVMGERGARYLSENQSATFTFLPGIGDDITYAKAVALRDLLIDKFLTKKISSALVAYAHFLSLTVQNIEVVRILPCGDIFGQARQSAAQKAGRRQGVSRQGDFLIEPSAVQVVDYLVRASLMQRLYDIFWESKLSECAARIIHLEGSHEEVLGVHRRLMSEYFKHLHERNDKTIREIFASRLHWKQSA